MEVAEQFTFTWNEYPQHTVNALEELRIDDDLMDVTLVADGRRIKAHKVLLSACSVFFRETFKENPCKHPVVILKGVTFQDLQSVVQFVYNGKASLSHESLSTFMDTAKMLQIKGISQSTNIPRTRKKDVSTNTDEQVVVQNPDPKPDQQSIPKVDSGCQTEEITEVQFGLRNEIPVIFYKAFLNDSGLQQKIAQTINEHVGSLGEGESAEKEKVVQKVSSQAETEIDKFLVDLLKDMPDDSNSSSIHLDGGFGEPTSFADIERNLTSMFRDDSEDSPSVNVVATTVSPQTKALSEDTQEHVRDTTPSSGDPKPGTSAPITRSSSRASERARTEISPKTPGEGQTSGNSVTTPSDSSSPSPQRSQRHVKRITPTPLPCANVNPVFNASVIVEKKTVDLGEKSAKLSVITTDFNTSAWHGLKRRSITPKIPGQAQPMISSPFRVHNVDNGDQVVKLSDLKKEEQLRKKQSAQCPRSPMDVTLPSPSTDKIKNKNDYASSLYSESEIKSRMYHSVTSSTSKRKATPMKLTPEKAKNSDYNFMHFFHDANKPTQASSTNEEPTSTVKKTPVTSVPSANMNPPSSSNGVISLIEVSEVTPMQPPPVADSLSTSSCKTISPNAIQRLIASANRIGAPSNSAGNYFHNKKKSYSTPRKRKHVRSLSFATPPSLKVKATPGSEPSHGDGEEVRDAARKRKAVDDLVLGDLKSKKRLNWPESEKKNTTGTNNSATVARRSSSDTLVTSSTTDVYPEIGKPVACCSKSTSQIMPVSNQAVESVRGGNNVLSMSTILEESMNISSVDRDESIQVPTVSGVPTSVNPIVEPMSVIARIPNSPQQLTIISVPIQNADGTTHLRYYTIGEDGIPVPVSFMYPTAGEQNTSATQGQAVNAVPVLPPAPGEQNTSAIQEQAVNAVPVLPPAPGEQNTSTTQEQGVKAVPALTPAPLLPMPMQKEKESKKTAESPKEPVKKESKRKEKSSKEKEKESKKTAEPPKEPAKKESKRKEKSSKEKEKPKKKPAVMFNKLALFGNTPTKDQKAKSTTTTSSAKLPSDVVAAQAVAFQAVPLGTISRKSRSPRKSGEGSSKRPGSSTQPVSTAEKGVQKSSFLSKTPPDDSKTTEVPRNQIEQQQQQPNTTFNIVPAPIGFPEPTPMKNYAETGCLNISDITCNTGPLVTPFKSAYLPALNETHFTLPPTPRVMMEDPDSNSNSNSGQSIRLMFDGMYPSNLLSSTPLKPGTPKTPGRTSHSSNSQSPVQPGRSIPLPVTAVSTISSRTSVISASGQAVQQSVIVQPQQQALSPVLLHTTKKIPTSFPVVTASTAQAAASIVPSSVLSSPRHGDKSDGEISSSEDEGDKKPQPKKVKIPKSAPAHIPRTSMASSSQQDRYHHAVAQSHISSASSSTHRPTEFVQQNLSRQPPSQAPYIGVSLNSNLKRTHGINFQVGGREKCLTMSEKKALLSLMQMRNLAPDKAKEPQKENFSEPVAHSSVPSTSSTQQETPNEEQRDNRLLKSTSLERLLKIVKRKHNPNQK